MRRAESKSRCSYRVEVSKISSFPIYFDAILQIDVHAMECGKDSEGESERRRGESAEAVVAALCKLNLRWDWR
jgi:hypothetical protein